MSKPSKSPSLDAMISGLPDKLVKKEKWTLEEDAALLKWGGVKGIARVAEAMGKSKGSAYARYHLLKKALK